MQNNTGNRKSRRNFTGVVLSDKMDKTVVVSVMSFSKHPKYKKITRRYAKFKAHDEKNAAKTGDKVKIIETRPISKDKRWRVLEILESKAQ
jgi:small subunit ribosomal protein S17